MEKISVPKNIFKESKKQEMEKNNTRISFHLSTLTLTPFKNVLKEGEGFLLFEAGVRLVELVLLCILLLL